jgi:hypothetical protein
MLTKSVLAEFGHKTGHNRRKKDPRDSATVGLKEPATAGSRAASSQGTN